MSDGTGTTCRGRRAAGDTVATPVADAGDGAVVTSDAERHERHDDRAVPSPGSSGFVDGNRVTLLRGGEAYFSALEAAFDGARHEIHLETYIYRDDAVGRQIADALARAAARGVAVRVVVDGFGSSELPRRVREGLRARGVEILVFGPRISPWTLRRERLRRLHRKIVVVDREIAFVGGINIVDDVAPGEETGPRYDYAVAVQGPLVDAIRLSARRLWRLVAWRSLRKAAIGNAVPPAPSAHAGTVRAAFLVRDNFRHRRDIEIAYMGAIEQAEREIILAHAYFLPGTPLRRALVDAARRGVRVMLVLQGKAEFFLERHASRALYGSLLDAGVEIHEYRSGLLHAKVATVDGRWATVGSSNIDPFSLLLSREANVVIDDEAFARMLTARLKETMARDCRQITAERWKRQPLGLRVVCWLCYAAVRLAVGLSGHVPAHAGAETRGQPGASTSPPGGDGPRGPRAGTPGPGSASARSRSRG